MDSELREHYYPMANMQSINNTIKALRLVFNYLKTNELLLVSQVCTSWKVIAMDSVLWQTVRLKNSMVCNWDKCIDAMNDRGSVSLDLRHMLIPTDNDHFVKFWSDFRIALKRAQWLKCLELYKCPPSIVKGAIHFLPQLTVVNATTIKNSKISNDGKNPKVLMTLSLPSLGKMTNLTELRIKGLTGLKLKKLPSLKSLVNLKALSLTSIKTFPKDVCSTLETLSTSLVFLEIGDCNYLSKDFAGVIKRLNNLTSLRLENCLKSFGKFAKEVLSAIRGLDNLKILELINIQLSNNVKGELEKFTNIKALLIIPFYVRCAATANYLLIHCLVKLSKTLTHLVWGLTCEVLHTTEELITNRQLSLDNMNYSFESLNNYFKEGNIPILRSMKRKITPGEESVSDENKQISKSNVDILPIPTLKIKLEKMMINTEIKVVKIALTETTRVYLLEYFNDL